MCQATLRVCQLHTYAVCMTTAATDAASGVSADQAIGLAVNQLAFARRVTRKSLGVALGISAPGVSRKIYGQTSWSVQDLIIVAAVLGVDPGDLLPLRLSQGSYAPRYAPGTTSAPAVGLGLTDRLNTERARRDSNPQPSGWEPVRSSTSWGGANESDDHRLATVTDLGARRARSA